MYGNARVCLRVSAFGIAWIYDESVVCFRLEEDRGGAREAGCVAYVTIVEVFGLYGEIGVVFFSPPFSYFI